MYKPIAFVVTATTISQLLLETLEGARASTGLSLLCVDVGYRQ